jgi:hypothetical protein
MGCSKDGEGSDGPGLSLVSGTQTVGGTAPEKATQLKLAQLRQEHHDLDEEIQALISAGPVDQLLLTRLKKRKLALRDQITQIEDDIVPDIIA